MGGAFPGDKYSNAPYENPGFGNHWIAIQRVGVRFNRSAIGARIHAEVIENGTQRSIYKHVNSGGGFGANPLRQTIGLGKASKIDVLAIFWPSTGLTQTFRNVPVDQFIQIIEGEEQYTTLRLKKLAFSSQTSPITLDNHDDSPSMRPSFKASSSVSEKRVRRIVLNL